VNEQIPSPGSERLSDIGLMVMWEREECVSSKVLPPPQSEEAVFAANWAPAGNSPHPHRLGPPSVNSLSFAVYPIWGVSSHWLVHAVK
jgi:hypothetical protein